MAGMKVGIRTVPRARDVHSHEHGFRWRSVCTENLIRVDDVMESPKLAE